MERHRRLVRLPRGDGALAVEAERWRIVVGDGGSALYCSGSIYPPSCRKRRDGPEALEDARADIARELVKDRWRASSSVSDPAKPDEATK